jgi:Acetoacetate decarboxylase (ADC)
MILQNNPFNGRLTESRLGRKMGDPGGHLAAWGSMPAPPVCGQSWLDSFQTQPGQLSNGLDTDRQWYAFDFTACLIKGFCQWDVIAAALAEEGIYPVGAYCNNQGPFAMATLWFNIIRDSVCGAYHEVILSIDVNHTQADTIAFKVRSTQTPWAVLYPTFGPSPCNAQYLQSLWIDSPLSIAWGREMQGFPKHPQPVTSTITDNDQQFSFDICWKNDTVLHGAVQKRFGVPGLVRESLGLVATHSLTNVLSFLAAPSFNVPIMMPSKTAAQNNVPQHYIGHLWKGLHPAAVQVWPWSPDDVLELGEVVLDSGCKAHNGNRLLREAEFQPVSVTYISRGAAFVETKPT